MENEKYVTIQGLLNKQHQDQKKLIADVDREEALEDARDSVESISNEINGVKLDINRKKKLFINEIKNGLGTKIKSNPNQVILLKNTRWDRFKVALKTLFTKF